MGSQAHYFAHAGAPKSLCGQVTHGATIAVQPGTAWPCPTCVQLLANQRAEERAAMPKGSTWGLALAWPDE